MHAQLTLALALLVTLASANPVSNSDPAAASNPMSFANNVPSAIPVPTDDTVPSDTDDDTADDTDDNNDDADTADDNTCDVLGNEEVTNCVLEKWIGLSLDETPQAICQVFNKDFYAPCIPDELKHCLDQSGEFEQFIASIKEELEQEGVDFSMCT